MGDFKGNAKGMVKTPTLRNITETAPYFHNGAIWSLKEAVKEMGSVQLGIKISDKDAADIVVFLNALTGTNQQLLILFFLQVQIKLQNLLLINS